MAVTYPPRVSSYAAHPHRSSPSALYLAAPRDTEREPQGFAFLRLFLLLCIVYLAVVRSSLDFPSSSARRRRCRGASLQCCFAPHSSPEENPKGNEGVRLSSHPSERRPREDQPLGGEDTKERAGSCLEVGLQSSVHEGGTEEWGTRWRLYLHETRGADGRSQTGPWSRRESENPGVVPLCRAPLSKKNDGRSYVKSERWSSFSQTEKKCRREGPSRLGSKEESSKVSESLPSLLSDMEHRGRHGEGQREAAAAAEVVGECSGEGQKDETTERGRTRLCRTAGKSQEEDEEVEVGTRKKRRRKKRRKEATRTQREAVKERRRSQPEMEDEETQDTEGDCLLGWLSSFFGGNRRPGEDRGKARCSQGFLIFAQGTHVPPSPSCLPSRRTESSVKTIDEGTSSRPPQGPATSPLLRLSLQQPHVVVFPPFAIARTRAGTSRSSAALLRGLHGRHRRPRLRRFRTALCGRVFLSPRFSSVRAPEQQEGTRSSLTLPPTPLVRDTSVSQARARQRERKQAPKGKAVSPRALGRPTQACREGEDRRLETARSAHLRKRRERGHSPTPDIGLVDTYQGRTGGGSSSTGSVPTRAFPEKELRPRVVSFLSVLQHPSSSSSLPPPSSASFHLSSSKQQEISRSPPSEGSHSILSGRKPFFTFSACSLSAGSSSSSLPLSSSPMSRASTEPVHHEGTEASLECMTEFERQMEELTGLELLEELKRRNIFVPGKEPGKVTEALVRVLHDELKALDKVRADEGSRPRREHGEGRNRAELEEKNEKLLSQLQRLSPGEALSYLQARQMPADGRKPRKSTEYPPFSKDVEEGREKMGESSPASKTPRFVSGDTFFEAERDKERHSLSQRELDDTQLSRDPSGIEPPEVRSFPEAACENFWKPLHAWRSELATLEDQLELCRETLDRARQAREEARIWQKKAEREDGGEAESRRNLQETTRGRQAEKKQEKSGEAAEAQAAVERDVEGLEDEENNVTEIERQVEERAVSSCRRETQVECQKGVLQRGGGHGKINQVEEAGESIEEEAEEEDDRSLLWGGRDGGTEDEGVLLTWGDERRDFPELVRVQDFLRREHVFIPLANPEKRKTFQRKEDEEEDGEEDDEEDAEAPEPQIIMPESFASSGSGGGAHLQPLRGFVEDEAKEEAEREEEEEELDYDEGNTERCTYTQAQRQRDMQRSAASLFFPSCSPERNGGRQRDPGGCEREHREKCRLTEQAMTALRGRTEGRLTGGDVHPHVTLQERSLEEDGFRGYCVGWSDLMAGKQGSRREEQIEDEETPEKRRGVVLLPDQYGWRCAQERKRRPCTVSTYMEVQRHGSV